LGLFQLKNQLLPVEKFKVLDLSVGKEVDFLGGFLSVIEHA
jgi:hypothetical protein